jgi:hypothetical protein
LDAHTTLKESGGIAPRSTRRLSQTTRGCFYAQREQQDIHHCWPRYSHVLCRYIGVILTKGIGYTWEMD